MAKEFIPTSIDDITAVWLTEALNQSGVLSGGKVSNVRAEAIGEQGYMGVLARLHLEYDDANGTAPATMIAKMPTQETKNKITGELFLNYERENRMYEDILKKLPIRTPECYYSNWDPGPGNTAMSFIYFMYNLLPKKLMGAFLTLLAIRMMMYKRRYILLLEDYQNLEYIDQRDGCCFDDAKKVMKPIGLAQAVHWNDQSINNNWLKPHSEISTLMALLFDAGLPVIKQHFGDKLSQKEVALYDWLVANHSKLDAYIRTRPTTLVHSDYRIDNIFFDREKDEIAIIDWQTGYMGLGVADLAYFCTGSGDRAFTPEQIDELITIYHSGLVEGGVSNYSLDECRQDYKYGQLVAIRYVLIILGALEIDKDENIKVLVSLWLERMRPQIETIDLDALF